MKVSKIKGAPSKMVVEVDFDDIFTLIAAAAQTTGVFPESDFIRQCADIRNFAAEDGHSLIALYFERNGGTMSTRRKALRVR